MWRFQTGTGWVVRKPIANCYPTVNQSRWMKPSEYWLITPLPTAWCGSIHALSTWRLHVAQRPGGCPELLPGHRPQGAGNSSAAPGVRTKLSTSLESGGRSGERVCPKSKNPQTGQCHRSYPLRKLPVTYAAFAAATFECQAENNKGHLSGSNFAETAAKYEFPSCNQCPSFPSKKGRVENQCESRQTMEKGYHWEFCNNRGCKSQKNQNSLTHWLARLVD